MRIACELKIDSDANMAISYIKVSKEFIKLCHDAPVSAFLAAGLLSLIYLMIECEKKYGRGSEKKIKIKELSEELGCPFSTAHKLLNWLRDKEFILYNSKPSLISLNYKKINKYLNLEENETISDNGLEKVDSIEALIEFASKKANAP